MNTKSAKERHSSLIQASIDGDIERIRDIVATAGVDIDGADKYGLTSLMWASGHGHDEAVRVLIEAGADVNAQNKKGNTALIAASKEGRNNVVKELIAVKAEVDIQNSQQGDTALIMASGHGHEEVVKMLIKAGADVNTDNHKGDTSLIVASRNGRNKVVKILVEAGADVNTPNKKGDTALITASRNGHDKVIKTLNAVTTFSPVKIDVKNKKGKTALEVAKMNKRKDIVKILKPHFHKKNRERKEGNVVSPDFKKEKISETSETPSRPIFGNNTSSICNVNLQNKVGDTALIVASRSGHVGVAKLLVDGSGGNEAGNMDKKNYRAVIAASFAALATTVMIFEFNRHKKYEALAARVESNYQENKKFAKRIKSNYQEDKSMLVEVIKSKKDKESTDDKKQCISNLVKRLESNLRKPAGCGDSLSNPK